MTTKQSLICHCCNKQIPDSEPIYELEGTDLVECDACFSMDVWNQGGAIEE